MSSKKSCPAQRLRIPEPVDDIQVNFCKRPGCKNFGVPASLNSQPRGRPTGSSVRDGYSISGTGRKESALKCGKCGEYHPIKSNQGIAEELKRMTAPFKEAPPATCPNSACLNHGRPVGSGKGLYKSKGYTKAQSRRYQCQECGKTFSVGKSTLRHRKPHLNKQIFKLIVNKVALRRICEIAEVNPETVYGKLRFFREQCLKFAADRERRLMESTSLRRMYISVDRQEYAVNWTSHLDRRNIVIQAVGSADLENGYVFGMHSTFDPGLDAELVNKEAKEAGDLQVHKYFRKHARLWLWPDYAEATSNRKSHPKGFDSNILARVQHAYEQAMLRDDIEALEQLSAEIALPNRGMQVHSEYTLYAHFFYLKSLLKGVTKVRFFLDQDSGMRAACLGAFADRVKGHSCEAFYVRTNSEMTIDEKKMSMAKAKARFDQMRAVHPNMPEHEVKRLMVKQQLASMKAIGHWKDRWMVHPLPKMSEPEKAVCHLTDMDHLSDDHLANLYLKATLHPIDKFFMQARRKVMYLERPFLSASGAGRVWHGYSPYNPEMINVVLDIFRVYYNYCTAGEDKKTPAQRLGLARGRVDVEKILYYGYR